MRDIYICGPMTNYPYFNFPAFEEAAATLRAQGMTVISPNEEDAPEVQENAKTNLTGSLTDGKVAGHTWGEILAKDVIIVADRVRRLALLPGWERSKGAKLEITVALLAGKPAHEYHKGQGIGPELDRAWLKDVLFANL